MDALPLPDYDEYAALAEKHGLLWLLSIEGSRGCWWDRSRRSGNARATCHFCNLNVQWMGYREKSVARLVAEVREGLAAVAARPLLRELTQDPTYSVCCVAERALAEQSFAAEPPSQSALPNTLADSLPATLPDTP